MVEQFGLQEFIDALEPYRKEGPDFDKGEFVWKVVTGSGAKIAVRSSIALDGKSAGAGLDSIRVWLTSQTGAPLAPKVQKYVTRVSGWQGRMQKVIDELLELSTKLGKCPKCGAPIGIKESHTAKNPGKIFKVCSAGCQGWIGWFDGEAPASEPSAFPLQANKPKPVAPAFQAMAAPAPKANVPSKKIMIRGSVPVTEPGVSYVGFTPSKYQSAIFDFVRDRDENLVIEALAGSGKTKTLTQLHDGSLGAYALRKNVKNLSVLALAFNVKVARALAEVMPQSVVSRTVHSACWAAVKTTFNLPGNAKPNTKKTWDKFKELTRYNFDGVYEDNAAAIVRLVSLLKVCVFEPTQTNIDWLVRRFNLVLDGDLEKIYNFVADLFLACVNDFNVIDFDDMLYWVAIGVAKPEQYDFVTDDEAQDANPAQEKSILKMVKPGGRVVVVGDRWQSIYGFAGADLLSMQKFEEALNATVLPLSVCYRCPSSHLDLVRSMFPHIKIENGPNAIEGTISTIDNEKLVETAQPGSLVLCRINAPLAKNALMFIRAGKKAAIRGRDIGANLISVIKKVGKRCDCGDDVDVFMSGLQDYTEREAAKLLAADRESAASLVQDQADTIIALADGVNTVRGLIERTESIFSDESIEGVTFSTLHKAKGDQANDVFIMRPDLMPHPMAKTSDDLQQETNLKYVAHTRAMKTLTYVEDK